MSTKICPECGTEQKSEFKFCNYCGAKFSNENRNDNNDIVRCKHCGTELHEEAFCPDCGNPTGITICPNCRQKTVNENFCSVCGYKINKNVKVCSNCGSTIDAKAKVCAKCGAKAVEKSPFLALILSFLLPGLGQLYNRQNHKGIMLIIGYVISLILSLILIGAIIVFIIWIYGMYDAYTSAKAINNGEVIEDRIF